MDKERREQQKRRDKEIQDLENVHTAALQKVIDESKQKYEKAKEQYNQLNSKFGLDGEKEKNRLKRVEQRKKH